MILYNYRRCPFAMRARMALKYAGLNIEVREIKFSDKPSHMLEISPKGTVPVLQIGDGKIIDESRDIVMWALNQNDPDGWLDCNVQAADYLINVTDMELKKLIDKYKYPDRYKDEDCEKARYDALFFIQLLDDRLIEQDYLMGDKISFADITIFPFIRQYAHVDKEWFFEHEKLKQIQDWLDRIDNSELFNSVMIKYPVWEEGNDAIYI